MDLVNLLKINEVFSTLLLFTDAEGLRKLWEYNPALEKSIMEPHNLDMITKKRKIPRFTTVNGVPVNLIKSMEDLLFAMELRDPILRSQMCLSRRKMVDRAIYEHDLALLKDLKMEDPTYYLINSQAFEVGKTGNVEIIDYISREYPFVDDRIYLGGLVAGHHNDLYHQYAKKWNFDLSDAEASEALPILIGAIFNEVYDFIEDGSDPSNNF